MSTQNRLRYRFIWGCAIASQFLLAANVGSARLIHREVAHAPDDEGIHLAFLIREELKNLEDHPWAGSYQLAMTAGMVLAPKSGFVFEVGSCQGALDHNLGDVEVDEHGVVHLKCALPTGRGFLGSLDTHLQPVRWGERRYLVPVYKLREFCNDVNSGELLLPYSFDYFLRIDHRGLPSGLPDVPEEYRKYLLPKPLEAKIIKIADNQLVVNLGTADGAFDGMKLFLADAKYDERYLVLTEVGEHESKARVKGPDGAALAVGQPLSSRLLRCLVERPEKP